MEVAKTMRARHFLPGIAVLLSLHAAAQEPRTFEPADFPEDQGAILSQIRFPNTDGDIFVRVFCDTYLNRSGEFEKSYCWPEPAETGDPFMLAVLRNIDSSRIKPARVDGDVVEVYFQYTVQFERRGETESIRLFPHQFVGIEGDGTGYIGPQRYINPRIPVGLLSRCEHRETIWFAMVIDEAGGKPTEVRTLTEGHDPNCLRYFTSVAENGTYIPAFLNGAPATAPYREAWTDFVEDRVGR